MKKILVVDDDVAILEAVQASLEFDDYLVCTATDGKNAIDKAISESPDMIILDVLLSGDDGRDVARVLKSDIVTSSIPILMVSAHPNVQQTVLDAGADDFLPKPFDVNELLEKASVFTNRQS